MVNTSTKSRMHYQQRLVLVPRVPVISPRGQYEYPEYLSSPLDVSTSTKNPSHLPYMSVLVLIVQDTSNSGQL